MTDTPHGWISAEELQLATRNHGMPLEALSYQVTPVGLHYLLIHYDIPAIDAERWRLHIDGAVARPLELSLTELRAMPSVTRAVTMECAGNGRALLEPRPASQPWLVEAVGTGEWTGVPLAALLEHAGLENDAIEILFTGADRGFEGGVEQSYERAVPIADATDGDVLAAYELNGAPLPPQHGFPLRLVVPGWYGMTNVKWLAAITALTTPFDGYQHERAYRLRDDEDDPGTPVTRMLPRSLLLPPGIPDFFTRGRTVSAGECELFGRAWSGHGSIIRVDVSTDGGSTWRPATVEPPAGPHAWQAWHAIWDAAPGEYELCCRAADAVGHEQPLTPDWNVGGYTNNAAHRISVTVVEPE
jgi:sulfane dehydrogenase subunit SoxC